MSHMSIAMILLIISVIGMITCLVMLAMSRKTYQKKRRDLQKQIEWENRQNI